MINMQFSIWIASKTKWAHLIKDIQLESVPMVGNYIKFNCFNYDYIPWKITQITFRENCKIEVWTELLDNIDNRNYSFEEENEFLECYNDFLKDNWICERGIGENTRYKNIN